MIVPLLVSLLVCLVASMLARAPLVTGFGRLGIYGAAAIVIAAVWVIDALLNLGGWI